jgi:hypothetical protein
MMDSIFDTSECFSQLSEFVDVLAIEGEDLFKLGLYMSTLQNNAWNKLTESQLDELSEKSSSFNVVGENTIQRDVEIKPGADPEPLEYGGDIIQSITFSVPVKKLVIWFNNSWFKFSFDEGKTEIFPFGKGFPYVSWYAGRIRFDIIEVEGPDKQVSVCIKYGLLTLLSQEVENQRTVSLRPYVSPPIGDDENRIIIFRGMGFVRWHDNWIHL